MRLQSLDFIDSEHGWVVAANMLLSTDDGGAHWHAIGQSCPVLRSVNFVDADLGFAVAGGSTPLGAIGGHGPHLMATHDGGLTWRTLTAPPDIQSVCFADAAHGWLGADGHIYATRNAGQSWTLQVTGAYGSAQQPALAEVRCIRDSPAVWAELDGPGGMMSQGPHIGYHSDGAGWTPIFAEQYFPHPSVAVSAQSPGSYAGPFAVINASQAVYIDTCPACPPPGTPAPTGTNYTTYQGTAPSVFADRGGSRLAARGPVAGLTVATGASFVTATDGWVIGTLIAYHLAGSKLTSTAVNRIVHTTDGGASGQTQYELP
jgi:hypothetical protein